MASWVAGQMGRCIVDQVEERLHMQKIVSWHVLRKGGGVSFLLGARGSHDDDDGDDGGPSRFVSFCWYVGGGFFLCSVRFAA